MPKRTIKQAIKAILEVNGKPLSPQEIYEQILEKNLYRFRAEFPLSIIRTQIRRHCEGVDFPSARPDKYFIQTKDGKYWLKDIPLTGKAISTTLKSTIKVNTIQRLKELHLDHISSFKEHMLNELKSLDWQIFEHFCKRLLEVYGFKDLVVTQAVKDKGIDGYGKLKIGISYFNVAFQCKRWKSTTISRPEIDKFRGACQGKFDQAIIFTTSNFSRDTKKASNQPGAIAVFMVDGPAIVDILIEEGLGVATESLPIYINALDEILSEDIS